MYGRQQGTLIYQYFKVYSNNKGDLIQRGCCVDIWSTKGDKQSTDVLQ